MAEHSCFGSVKRDQLTLFNWSSLARNKSGDKSIILDIPQFEQLVYSGEGRDKKKNKDKY